MPTRPTKGDHGHNDQGSSGRGPQKAVVGSGVSPEVAEEQAESITGEEQEKDEEQAAPE